MCIKAPSKSHNHWHWHSFNFTVMTKVLIWSVSSVSSSLYLILPTIRLNRNHPSDWTSSDPVGDAGQLENQSSPREPHPLSLSRSVAVYFHSMCPPSYSARKGWAGERRQIQETARQKLFCLRKRGLAAVSDETNRRRGNPHANTVLHQLPATQIFMSE